MIVRPLADDELALVDARLPLHRLGQTGTYLVAWDGNEPVAHAFVAWSGTKLGIPEIQDVFVAPDRRRNGVATALSHAAENEVQRRGYDRISLSVGLANQAARALYEKLGYEPAGIDPEHVRGTIVLRGKPLEVDDTLVSLVKPTAS